MDFVTQVNLSLFEVWIGMKRMNTYLNKKLFVSKWHYTITKEFCPRVKPEGIIFHNDSYNKHLKKQ